MAFSQQLIDQFSTALDSDQEPGEDTQMTNHELEVYRNGSIALINGALYFFVSVTGGENLKNFLSLPDENANHFIYPLSVGASICYTMFVYKTLENLTLKPQSYAGWALTLLAPFAASSFFTAGLQGTEDLSISSSIGIPIGLVLFLFRCISMIDGSVKFPTRGLELISELKVAVYEKNKMEIARLLTTLYTALGFSLSTTDSIYASSNKLVTWAGVDSENPILKSACYVTSAIGAIGTFPLAFYWTYRGLRQLTFGGNSDENGVVKDPTDIHTVTGAIATIPVTLGILGSATAATGKVFAEAGLFSSIVRVSSAFIYSIAGGIPGLSTLSRGISSKLPTLSSCKSILFKPFTGCRKKELENDQFRLNP